MRAMGPEVHLVVLDPTCSEWKNVTPNCYRIAEITTVFKRFTTSYEQLIERLAGCFNTQSTSLAQGAVTTLIGLKIEEWFGSRERVVESMFGGSV